MPASQHLEWLRLVDVSGPFLSPTVLDDRLTQGLQGVPTSLRQSLRQAHEEWRDGVDLRDCQLPALHKAWIAYVLRVGLDWSDRELVTGDDPAWRHLVEEHGIELRPDFTLIGSDRAPLAFVHVLPPDGDPTKPPARDRWAANAIDRMVHLCRAKQVRVGLITDGERWVVVNAPIGSTSGWATWLARIWWQEPQTFQAFRTLLEVRRWFGPADQALPGLLDASAEAHDEITTTLGEQVRQAVEAIIQALDRLNRDQGGRLLAGVSERQLYEAGLTVMMRLVVLLCAEERGLLPVEEPLYQESYAIYTLRGQLDALPDEVLERRHSAWSRMFALVRGVYGGIAHDRLRLPALGGSIFDPDRYPFLEGRTDGTTWREVPAIPLLIDDRVVLYLLRSLQILERRAGAQLLSFRALDVEQIGHVYEGLLEHTVLRMTEPALGLTGSLKVPTPCVLLVELEAAHKRGAQALADFVAERTGRQARTIVNELTAQPDAALRAAVVRASGGDSDLARRAIPFAGLLRCDARGERLVYGMGSVLVSGGADRREFGSHYTPRHLAEKIVAKTLELICYTKSDEDRPRGQWVLHAPAKLLDLKICDPAMGSGAFLVASCRYLADRLIEAWRQAEDTGNRISDDGSVHDDLGDSAAMSADADERMTRARQLVAERCLYGVDINPVAVELAKLSIWLVTLSKGRPFGFLNHNLRCGDSLLGIYRLEQLIQLSMNPTGHGQLRLFGQSVDQAVRDSIQLRSRLREIPIRDIRDVEAMTQLDIDARRKIEVSESIADALIGEVFASQINGGEIESALASLSVHAVQVAGKDQESLSSMRRRTAVALSIDLPRGNPARKPFHWPLEFPEVFANSSGFNATLGNPPWGASLPEADVQYLRSTYTNSAYKLINSFKFFVERMDQITANATSVYSFLVPSSLLEHIGCRDTRALLLSRKPIMLIDCGDGMFHGITQSCCFGVIDKRIATESHQVALGTFESYFNPNSSRNDGGWTSKSIQQIRERKNCVFCHGADTRSFNGGTSVPLVELANVFDSGIDYSRAALGNAVFYSGISANDQADHKVLRGRNVQKFSLRFEGIWLRSNWRSIQKEHIALDAKSRLKVNEKAYAVSPKILVRQTGDQIIATVDSNSFYHQKSLLCIVPKDGVSPFFLCAVLNHPAMTKIYRSMTMQSGKVFSQVKKNFLEQLPIPSSFGQSERLCIAELAEKLIRANGQDAALLAQLEGEVAKGFIDGEAAAPQETSIDTDGEAAS